MIKFISLISLYTHNERYLEFKPKKKIFGNIFILVIIIIKKLFNKKMNYVYDLQIFRVLFFIKF